MRKTRLLCIWLISFFIVVAAMPHSVSAQAKVKKVKKEKKAENTVVNQPNTGGASRLALVIGNSNYDFSLLSNPVNDATDMASTLQGLGFNVILKKNADLQSMEEALEDFGNRLKTGGVGLFFYAGHGVQVAGNNYLIPVGAKINKESDVKFKTVDANRVFAEMENANNGFNIVILDACRDNPFKSKFRSISRGLAIVSDAPIGTFIAYSTGPGKVAADGEGRNSPYTSALLRYMKEPGLAIEDVFKNVRQRLNRETGGKQTPWEVSSLQGKFFFQPSVAASDVAPVSTPISSEPLKLQKPSDTGFSLDDLEKKAKEVEANKAQWSNNMKKMKTAFNQVSAYDKKNVSPGLKISAWQRFLGSYAGNDPYSEEDDNLRNRAQEQITRLEEKRLAMAKPPARLQTQPTTGASSLKDPVTGMEFVFVKGGCYDMGDTFGDGEAVEKPVHNVCVSDFYMGKHEVKVGQFMKFVNDTSYKTEAEKGGGCYTYTGKVWGKDSTKNWRDPGFSQTDEHPVVCVSWNDSNAYIDWFNRKTGKTYRLPTEAEWEYAARSGGKNYKYSWGNGSPSGNIADESGKRQFSGWTIWQGYDDGYVFTAPEGQFKPNDIGLYDMSGNVWEWCQDRYDKSYYSNSSKDNPQGPSSGSHRVLRGGSWFDIPGDVRAAGRLRGDPGYRDSSTGFRVVLSGR